MFESILFSISKSDRACTTTSHTSALTVIPINQSHGNVSGNFDSSLQYSLLEVVSNAHCMNIIIPNKNHSLSSLHPSLHYDTVHQTSGLDCLRIIVQCAVRECRADRIRATEVLWA